MLGWIYLGRIGVVMALLLRLPFDSSVPAPGLLYIVAVVLATAIFSIGSYWTTRLRARSLPRSLLYGQIFFDISLLTILVYLTGGPHSIFAPLYILVISAGALLLPFVGGLLTGLLASLLFLIAAVAASGRIDAPILLQTALFAVVAVVTGYVGDRLRNTGRALGVAETALYRLRLDTDDIFDNIETGLITVDGRGYLAYMNPAASAILSLRLAEWVDRPVLGELDRVAPGLGAVIERTASGMRPIRRFETSPATPDSFILGVSTTVVERSDGGRPPVTVVFQDITERMRVEGLRRRAERLEAVAELSASLAHEIKNPLAAIRSAVEQLASGQLDGDDSEVLTVLIVREANRVSGLLGDFIDFARVKVVAPTPLEFDALVNEVVEVVRNHPDARSGGVRINFSRPLVPVRIRGAEEILRRAIFNLTLNGAQWAGEGGSVDLTLAEVRSDILTPAFGALPLARLVISDTGPGIADELRDQIFDPFFTRRPGGTGLGLSMVQRAVEAHGGMVFIDPAREGTGTTFSLYLPVLELTPESEPLPVSGRAAPPSLIMTAER
jgi:two-component system sensor histidine kinase PilS (NtrC family)